MTGPCLPFALQRSREILGRGLSESVVDGCAAELSVTGRWPTDIAGAEQIAVEGAAPGDLLLLATPEGLHAAVVVSAGLAEDLRGDRGVHRWPIRRARQRIVQCWRVL